MQKIFIQHDSTILRIYPALAEEIGLNESLVLLQLQYLISISKTEKHDGYDWTYQSLTELRNNYFTFWSRDTINRTIQSLIDSEYIIIGNFNKKKYDKTRWIRLNFEKLSELKSIKIDAKSDNLSENRTRKKQNRTTIPEIPTENTTYNNNATHLKPDIEFKNYQIQTFENHYKLFWKVDFDWTFTTRYFSELKRARAAILKFTKNDYNQAIQIWDKYLCYFVENHNTKYPFHQEFTPIGFMNCFTKIHEHFLNVGKPEDWSWLENAGKNGN